MRVALDAGHGSVPGHGHTGAAANGLIEDQVALDMVKRIGHHLRAAGHETVLTRPDEKLVTLAQRTAVAKAHRCDMFLSIHCNAGRPSASGVEAFVAEGDQRSRAIAIRLVDAVASHGLPSRGVKWDSNSQYSRLAVLRGTYKAMPAVLLEVGFLSNAHDVGLLREAGFREEAAKVVGQAVVGSV
jgi:N-acetylmuramoyl-L-alanine amidase